jgi:hypothetical protein
VKTSKGDACPGVARTGAGAGLTGIFWTTSTRGRNPTDGGLRRRIQPRTKAQQHKTGEPMARGLGEERCRVVGHTDEQELAATP